MRFTLNQFFSYSPSSFIFYDIVLLSCCLALTFLMHPSIRLDMVSLKDTRLCTIRAQSDLVMAYLQTIVKNEDIEYKLNKLIECTCPIDVLLCAAANPLQFQKDQADVLKQRVYRETRQFLKVHESYFLRGVINEDNLKLLEEVFEMNSETEFHEWMKLLKEVYLEVLIQQDLKDDDGNVYGYHQFINQINGAHQIQREIKSRQQNQDNLCCTKLKQLKNYDRFENKINNSQFNKSIQYKICENIKKIYNQTQIEDNILSKCYQYQISNKINKLKTKYNLDEKDLPLDTNSIWLIIENKLLIERIRQSNEKDVQSHMKLFTPKVSTSDEIKQQIEFSTRIAEDKLFEKTTSKIARKSNLQSYDNIPYFSSLIKDFKRLSLVFNKSEHIFMFVEQLKMQFGENYEKEVRSDDQNVLIRIREIKNKFEAQLKLEPSDQRDLKVIFEIQQPKRQLSLFLECQCNVLSLMRWKLADHLFQDFISAEDNHKSMVKHINQNDILEKLFRNVIRMLQCIIILIAIQISGKITLKFLDHTQKMNTELNCHKGFTSCFEYCMKNGYENYDKMILKEHCQFQLENQGLDNHSKKELMFFCNKYNKTTAANTCFNIFKPGMIAGTSNEHICQYNKPDFVECTDNFMSDTLKSIGKFYKVIISNDKLAVINNQHELSVQQEDENFSKQDNIKTFITKTGSKKIRDLKLSESRACTLSDDQNLSCSKSVQHFNTHTVSTGKRHSCQINLGKLHCWGKQLYGKIKVPFELLSNVHSVSAGIHFTCASKYDTSLHCFGYNFYGELDYDKLATKNTVNKFSTKYTYGCLINNQAKLYCWGSKAPYSPSAFYFRTDAASKNKDAIDDSFGSNLTDVSVGNDHMCVIQMPDKLKCMGANEYGKSDVPIEFLLNIRQTSLGLDHTCAINKQDRLGCWGTSMDGNVPVPKQYNQQVMHVKTRQHTCVIYMEYKLACWGGIQSKLTQSTIDARLGIKQSNLYNLSKLEIPVEQTAKKTQIFAVGHGHTTAVNEKGLMQCWGESNSGHDQGVCDIPVDIYVKNDVDTQANNKVMVPKQYYTSTKTYVDNENNNNNELDVLDGGYIIKSGFTVNKVESFVLSSDDNVCWKHSMKNDNLNNALDALDDDQQLCQLDGYDASEEYQSENQNHYQENINSNHNYNIYKNDQFKLYSDNADFKLNADDANYHYKRPKSIDTNIDTNYNVISPSVSNSSIEYDSDSTITSQRKERRKSQECFSLKQHIDTVQCNIDSKTIPTTVNPQNNMMCLTITDLCYVPIKNNRILKCKNRKTMYKYIQKEFKKEIISLSCGQDRVCVLKKDKSVDCQGGLNIQNQNDIHRKMTKIDTQSVVASKQTTCIMKTNKKLQCNGHMAKTTPDKINWDLKIIDQGQNIK